MNKKELVNLVAEKTGFTKKDSKEAVDAVLAAVEECLVGSGEVNVPPLGKFVVTERAARKGRNPQTGEELDIPAKNVAKFKPSKGLKESVNS